MLATLEQPIGPPARPRNASHYSWPARTITTAAQHASHHSWLPQISTRFLWKSPRIVAVKMNQAPPAAGGYPLTYPLLAATQI